MNRSKGQSHLVEYVLTFFISVVVVVVIYFLVTNVYNSQLVAQSRDELKQLETQTLNSILNLYTTGSGHTGSIPNNTAILLGSTSLRYPTDVAGRPYEIILVSANPLFSTANISENTTLSGGESSSGPRILGRTTSPPIVEHDLSLPNIDVIFQGSVSNGLNATLSFYKANINGTTRNIITLGNVSLIATVTGIE